MLPIITVMIVFCFVQFVSFDLSVNFVAIVFVMQVVASIIPFGKKVRRRGKRRSKMMLAPRIVHFLVVPIGRPSVLTPPRCLSVVLLLLGIILLASSLGLLLNGERPIRGPCLGRLASWKLCGELGY